MSKRWLWARAVQCPYCKSIPGVPCFTRNGVLVGEHSSRIRAATQAHECPTCHAAKGVMCIGDDSGHRARRLLALAAYKPTVPPVAVTNPAPKKGRGDVWNDIIMNLTPGTALRERAEARRMLGISRYGTPLQYGNGRDVALDLEEELLDALAYAQQLGIEEANGYVVNGSYPDEMHLIAIDVQNLVPQLVTRLIRCRDLREVRVGRSNPVCVIRLSASVQE